MLIKMKSKAIAAILVLLWSAATGFAQSVTFTVLKSFTGADGANPYGVLVLSSNVLYGTTYNGGILYDGSSAYGTVYKINTNGSGFKTFVNFNDPYNGAHPKAGLALAGSTLYGTTYFGGNSTFCTVFKLNTDGSGFTVLKKNTSGNDGLNPQGELIFSDDLLTLYGTMKGAGLHDSGTVFSMNTDGREYTVLSSFGAYQDGFNPIAGLVRSGATLYGTTERGGGAGYNGIVFKLNTNGNSYTVLKRLTADDEGGNPTALCLAGSTLYGTTIGGGNSGAGTLFKMNTDGTGFSILKHFMGSDGHSPQGPLVLSGNLLYGTTQSGGSSYNGTVFVINTNGNSFRVLKHFIGSDGNNPRGGLVLSGNTLFGTTRVGGSSSNGTVFKLDLPAETAPQLAGTLSGLDFIISWPSTSAGYSLQENTNLSETNWTSVATLPSDDGTTKRVTVLPLSAAKFYRLKQ